MKIVPLYDKILVERLEAEKVTKGGIVLPDTAKEKPKQGKVVAVGTGKPTEEGEPQSLSVKVGDTIIFSSYAGTEVKVADQEYLIMSEDDVLATITPGKSRKQAPRTTSKRKRK